MRSHFSNINKAKLSIQIYFVKSDVWMCEVFFPGEKNMLRLEISEKYVSCCERLNQAEKWSVHQRVSNIFMNLVILIIKTWAHTAVQNFK